MNNYINDEYFEKFIDSLGRLNPADKINNLTDEEKEYLNNRFNNSSSYKESINRIKYKIETRPTCVICGGYVNYIKKNIFSETCNCKDCKNKNAYNKHLTTFKKNHNGLVNVFQLDYVKDKIKQTCLTKYGVEYSGQADVKKEKSKQTWIEKYNTNNPAKNDIIKEKSKQTCLERYNTEYSFQSRNNKEKSKQTCLKKYGCEYPTQSKEIQNKIKQTCLEKYGVENYLLTDSCIEKQVNGSFKKYGTRYPAQSKLFWDNYNLAEANQKRNETHKKNNSFKKSNPEDICFSLLKEKYNDVIRQYRSDIYPFNCDFYIPSIDTYIEYQGSHFHMGHPFDKNNVDDINKLNELKERSSKSDRHKNGKESQYDKMIYTWTDLDVRKRNIAKENNLNYLEFFSILTCKQWLSNE